MLVPQPAGPIGGLRVGHGYDLHRLKEGSGLYLGGFFVSCGYAAIAHSDGDVLCHAVIDTLLGALALDDIGTHFPPSEKRWYNANSLEMLRSVYKGLIQPKGFHLVNLDCTVILERVQLRLLINEIRAHLLQGFQTIDQADCQATTYQVGLEQISVKAKTKEGVDTVGRGEAVEVYASCLLQKLT